MSEILEPVKDLPKQSQLELTANTPGLLKTIKRNGKVVHYDESKIKVAITKAFIAVEGGNAAASNRIHQQIDELAQQITQTFKRRLPSGGTIHIEDIQDQVELALMRNSQYKIARAYVLYREERRKARATELKQQASDKQVPLITMPDGELVPLDMERVHTIVAEACRELTNVKTEPVIKDALRNLYNQASLDDVHKALIMAARALVETEPNYTFVSARLLLDSLRSEALSLLEIQNEATFDEMASLYPAYFKSYIAKGIQQGMLDPKLGEFDLDKLANALLPERDMQFTYLSLQTLYDRYFIHEHSVRYELPQAFFMRVAMGLAIREHEKEEKAIEFYSLLSSFDYMASTPTLFNSGTVRPQLSSCYLTTVPDDLDGIYSAIKDNALLSKFAGGLGNDWTPVRAMGSHIKGTNGKSQGVVPFLNVADATAIAVNQGGKRKGAVCAYLECWHRDVEEFLELRKNTGDDRRRTHDMNTALWVPDLFMKRVHEQGDWTLFSPDEVPNLHDQYGNSFETLYLDYEEKARLGKIKNVKTIPAIKLWRKMLSMLFETGHPWLTFKDACNLRSPQQHAGVIHSSNLCTEITLNTSKDEIAVCNLGSINLPAHIKAGKLDGEKLQQTIKTAIRMLDNVIDINYYSVPQARNSNLKHRPIGLGLMGFQDALYQLKLDYASEEAVEFADTSMELISYYAIEASCELAKERGRYSSYEGSLWSKGILPIDSINLLQQARGQHLKQDRSQRLDWESLRIKVRTQGMRNSNVMAIAPTATISNICGVSQSIEPTYQNLYVKSNLSGEFTVVNPYLVADLKALNLWDEVMVNDLKYFNGSVQPISRVPAELKARYATAFEIDPIWLVEAGSRRQKWLDQAQSLNIYMAKPSGKKLDELYRLAWVRGLKTTYYLRSVGASNAEKSTVTDGALNAVKINEPKACSITDPDCEACQ
ncbi:ribonucleoside-diphosphate reductase subunit alpha [Legionella oakridgensis]|uniref:Vitamin B12-dependent ribonucleotide reductase n=2 Tax=Legionella oakridgensis TaxID=29423 RepID=W0BCV3_9GAMM|nr:ribonucleoside-diphosphate reductase subunit alpha [Legionella oakridgensis]AHE67700.1 ribonucleoside-diphosphate reductase, adenosylcobalamin-dependent/ribonucleoside-diphosphate reductase, alpha, subunit [Legionella oakridgensis ATCC 33761 = DSM 21215]ETO92740.1 ribonucleoside-diphosphate reductase class II [Legionella oakridgensis RV-2-2007]KTD36967.1 ribonucleotide-diphosphate reductase subunit alpha [Legionella oakridgensis]STY20724.1 ribonucleoside-diphosphate reductase subunit alpha [